MKKLVAFIMAGVIFDSFAFSKPGYDQSKHDPEYKVSGTQVCDTQSIMATGWTICLNDANKSEKILKSAIDEGMAEVRRIDLWMSDFKPESLVSQINQNAGVKPVKVTGELLECFELSLKHSNLTGGAFDISFNVFGGLYKWRKGAEKFPTDEEIKKLLPLVNYKNIILNKKKKTVFLKEKGMRVGFGGMGQGWAVDRVVAKMKAKGISSGFVDGSGDTFFWGRKPDGKLWVVGIGDPRPPVGQEDSKLVLYKLYLTDVAVTTAGDTEHFFIKDGKRFHHIIDPHTGFSATRSAQVTAICKSAALCDLADDGIFILGPEKDLKYAESVGVEAVIVNPEKKITLTKGLTPVDTKWGKALEIK